MGSESETHTRGLPSVPFGFCGFGLGLYMRFCMFVVLGFARLIKSDGKKKKNLRLLLNGGTCPKKHTTVSPGLAHVHVIMYFKVLEFVV